MPNVNDFRKGQAVVSRETRKRRFAADFPGWGAPDSGDYLLPTPAGLAGTVAAVVSHGSYPWTRYSIAFADGTRLSDGVPGVDFDWQ